MGAKRANSFIARFSWLEEEGHRLDASAFASGALAIRDRLVETKWRSQPLATIADLFNGPRFPRRYVRDPTLGVPFLSSSDILLADLHDLPLLSCAATPSLQSLLIKQGWTLISCSGTIGNTAFVREEMANMAASQHVLRAVPHEAAVAPGYLFAFLTTRHGQLLLKQRTYGSVVQHIEPHQIADLPVPLPPRAFQERIHELVVTAAARRSEARTLLDEASNYFDARAGSMPSTHDHAYATGVVKRLAFHGRLDAFHYIGWGSEGHRLSGRPIGELGHVTRPGIVKRIYVEQGVPWVSGIDVYQVRVGFRQRLMRAEAEKQNCFLKMGQVLVQRSGSRYGLFGRPAYVGHRADAWAGSEHLMRITTGAASDAARIFAFLRSEVGRRTLVRNAYGTSIPEINPDIVRKVEVPDLPSDLGAGASRALQLRELADDDEERAIREVEAWLS